jgi:hypothetical protein
MKQVVLMIDDRSDVRQALADFGRAFRAIVEFFVGWHHDVTLMPRRGRLGRPKDCGPWPIHMCGRMA